MGSVLLPITPEKFTLKVKNSNKTITLINEAEVNILHDAGLTELEFDALIPAVRYSFANYDGDFKSPAFFTNHFEKLKTEKKPFQFIVVRQMPNGKLLFDTNMTVSMESYTIKESAKDGFDLIVSIKLKQYRFFSTKIVEVVNNTATVTKPQGEAAPEKETTVTVTTQRPSTNSPEPTQDLVYTAKEGDTKWNISKKFYGDGSKYNDIRPVNFDEVDHSDIDTGRNSNLVSSGQDLIIPARKKAVTACTLNY
jgi:hypothetical protein